MSALPGNRLMAMVSTQTPPLAQSAPFASNRNDRRPIMVVVDPGRPAYGRIRFGGQTDIRQALGVRLSIPGGAKRMVTQRRTCNAGSQDAVGRGVGHMGTLFDQRSVQYVPGRGTPVSRPPVAPHGWRLSKIRLA